MTLESAGVNTAGHDAPDRAPGRIEDLVRKLIDGVPALLGSARADLEAHFRSVLQQQLTRLDLCSRHEFDAQARVLARTQERLSQLEAKIVLLEQQGQPKA
jgi:ubiquinone biosynthesis accessory factor UbiK